MINKSKRTYLYWVPAIIWAGLIFFASHLPVTDTPPFFDFPGFDKLLHFVIFGILSVFILAGCVQERKIPLLQAAVISLFITSIYGALDEWHQSFIPERAVELADWLADTTGSLTFLLLTLPVVALRKDGKKTHAN